MKAGLAEIAAEKNRETQELRTVNQIRLEAESKLAAMNLAKMDPIMPAKKAPGTLAVSDVQVATNIYGLQLGSAKPVYRYQVTILGEINVPAGAEARKRKNIEFTGPVRGDPNCVSRRDDCRKIFTKLLSTYKQDFSDKTACYFYDLKAILFTIHPLEITDKKDYELATGEDFYAFLKSISVSVQKVTETCQLTLGELSRYVDPDLSKTDRSLQQFLEIAISQPVLFDPNNHVCLNGAGSYFMDPMHYGFSDRDTPALREGKYLAIGAQKSVRFVEGPKGRGSRNVAAIIETKKTPFHEAQPLIEKLKSMARLSPSGQVERRDLEGLRRGVKGLYVQTIHRKSNQYWRITDLLDETARITKLTESEQFSNVTIEQYFKQKYNLALKYPDAPLVGIKDRVRGLLKFPPEVLTVADNQRVTTEQQSREQISQQIRACAVLPSVLKEQVSKCANAIGLFNNKHLDEVGVKVIRDPLQVKARMLPAPAIVYGNNAPFQPDNRGGWRGDLRMQFLLPAQCQKWVVHVIAPNARDTINEQMTKNLVDRLLREAGTRGMKLAQPMKVGVVDPTEAAMNDLLNKCINNKVEFAFFVHAGMDTTIHGFMKYFELKGIITQDLKVQTARNIIEKNQSQTVENIIMKTNVKMGGLNWALSLAKPELTKMLDSAVLYIGFGTNHPGGGLGGAGEMAPPTVVGFAANDNKNHFEFTGDYVYQETRRDEKVDVMKSIIEKILDRYIKNRGQPPKCIVIYRNGCSEGQFEDVISYEIPFIRAAMDAKRVAAKLVVLVPNKLHNVRLLPSNIDRQARPPEQNVKPGMVIDTQVVHPTWNEFYLCSHTTLQGTAKVPRYTVLYADDGISADMIHGATFALAFGYQIVKSPTSLPAPAYIANKYADRGRTMLKAHLSSITNPAASTTNDALNRDITLAKVDLLRGRRINA